MNIIDIILIIVVILSIYSGWQKGFLQSFSDLITWLGSFLAAFFLSEYLVRLFLQFKISGIWIRPVFFIIFLLVLSRVFSLLFSWVSSKTDPGTSDHWANKLAGIIPGFISGAVYASFISFFALSYPLGNLSQRTKDSAFASLLNEKNQWPGKILNEMAADIGNLSPNSFTVHTKGAEIINLPFKTDDYSPRPDLAIRMLELINEERRKVKLKSMSFDKKLAEVAIKHSSDMLSRGYFSHYTPEGKSPFDRLRRDYVRFQIAGENLALAQTIQSAHEGLMESPMHKANILHHSFGRAGIGILDAGVHGIIITQNFRN